ncbi:MAG: outer membrane lipoprotein-sorting protein [Gemmatimonadota bacterium]|nr:MAG: outer membrane lipoprotein-sorting protein [Gemmatimonadota bacterium]
MHRTCTLSLVLALFSAPTLARGQESASEIIDRVDRIMRGESSHGIATMDVVTENWDRSMTMEIWSLGTDYSLIRITAPNKEAGTATLKAVDDIWNYLPRVDRTIKIPASLMMGAWMGSHFTNDDLVKESRLIEDYDIEISFEGEREGVEVWEFVLTPKPEAAVVWGRITYEVRKDDLMPTWARYYDEDDTLVRTLTFSDYRVMGGRLVPAAMDLYPEDKPGERTSVRYSEIDFDIEIDEGFFSLRSLRSRR